MRARKGAQALAHNFGSHMTPSIFPGGDLTRVKRQKNNDMPLKNSDEYSRMILIASVFSAEPLGPTAVQA
jgi:hypothetical protein